MDCCRVIDLRLQLLLRQSMDLCRHTCIHMSQDLYHSIAYLSIDRSIDLSVCRSIYLPDRWMRRCRNLLVDSLNCVTACFRGQHQHHRHDQCTRPVQAEIETDGFCHANLGFYCKRLLQFLEHTQFLQTWLEIFQFTGQVL